MCELNKRMLAGGLSLGLIKAARARLPGRQAPGWSADEQQKMDDFVNQPEVFDFGKPKSALEAPGHEAHDR